VLPLAIDSWNWISLPCLTENNLVAIKTGGQSLSLKDVCKNDLSSSASHSEYLQSGFNKWHSPPADVHNPYVVQSPSTQFILDCAMMG